MSAPPVSQSAPSTREREREAVYHAEQAQRHGQQAAQQATAGLQQKAAHDAGAAYENVREQVSGLGQYAHHRAEDVKHMASQSVRQAEGWVKRHPNLLTTLLLTGSFLFGLMFGGVVGAPLGWFGQSIARGGEYGGSGGGWFSHYEFGYPAGSMEAESHKQLDQILHGIRQTQHKVSGGSHAVTDALKSVKDRLMPSSGGLYETAHHLHSGAGLSEKLNDLKDRLTSHLPGHSTHQTHPTSGPSSTISSLLGMKSGPHVTDEQQLMELQRLLDDARKKTKEL